jgi:hypothetical protein
MQNEDGVVDESRCSECFDLLLANCPEDRLGLLAERNQVVTLYFES